MIVFTINQNKFAQTERIILKKHPITAFYNQILYITKTAEMNQDAPESNT